MMQQSRNNERLCHLLGQDPLRSCLPPSLGLRSLARLSTCSSSLHQAVDGIICSRNFSQAVSALDAAPGSKQHQQEVRWN
jgi:hypothetical protein